VWLKALAASGLFCLLFGYSKKVGRKAGMLFEKRQATAKDGGR
jgi:hypothetical protein